MLSKKPYNRAQAVEYARVWAFGRNPAYYDFFRSRRRLHQFISQCLYAGSRQMNFTPTFGWYYLSPNQRSHPGVVFPYLYNFLTTNKGVGPYARSVDIEALEPGDIIQLGARPEIFTTVCWSQEIWSHSSGCHPHL